MVAACWLFLLLVSVATPVFVQSDSCTNWGTYKEPISSRCEPDWLDDHKKLSEDAQHADRHHGWKLMFYGDSILEMFRGGMESKKPWATSDIHHVWKRHYMGTGKVKLSGVMAIGGDHTGHLLWRLAHGHVLRNWAPRACVVLIGTNDLNALLSHASEQPEADSTHAVEHVFSRLQAVVDALADAYPGTTILLMGILPRGDPTFEQLLDTSKLTEEDFNMPNKFTEPIRRINEKLADWVHDVHDKSFGMYRNTTLHYVGCSGPFMDESHHRINRAMMPDLVHPSAKGMEAIVACLSSHLQPILQMAAGAIDLSWRRDGKYLADEDADGQYLHIGAHDEL